MRYVKRKVSSEASCVGLLFSLALSNRQAEGKSTYLNLTRMRYKVYAVLPIKNSFIRVLYTLTC
jgi:hypothetical protein